MSIAGARALASVGFDLANGLDGGRGWFSADWTASDDSIRGGKSKVRHRMPMRLTQSQTVSNCTDIQDQSYLDCDENTALFRGSLDFETLGGAGFASQRTTGDDHEWDLSVYVGIKLEVAKGDSTSSTPPVQSLTARLTFLRLNLRAEKRYTFILKDDLLPPNKENGREQSTISWECDFELPPQAEPGKTRNKSVFIPWKSFNPTYRGKLQKDADPIDLKKIKRFSIMIRR